VNEVLNGIGDAKAFEKARLGVLPLGTMNVFARELKIPLGIKHAWEVLRRKREVMVDLPQVEFSQNGSTKKQYFIQLAGAGLDARAIELVDWSQKKQIGPFAYVFAGLKALREKKPRIKAGENPNNGYEGELVLIGNGKFYGGPFDIFPEADLKDGLLDVCVVPRADWPTLFGLIPNFIFRQRLAEKLVKRFRTKSFEVSGDTKAAFQLDGEGIGHLPVKFSMAPEKLRVVA
jgi:YegS/Rv2252/BmrU family lipid kinase